LRYIKAALRTPIAKKNKGFSKTIPEIFSSDLIKNILLNSGLDCTAVDELILANAFGTGGNITRNIGLRAGLENAICTSVDAQCSGGLRAVELLSQSTQNLGIAGGLESVSLAPSKFYHKADPRFSEEGYAQAEFSELGNQDLLSAASAIYLKYSIDKNQSITWMHLAHQRAHENRILLERFIDSSHFGFSDQNLRPDWTLEDWEKASSLQKVEASNTSLPADAAALVILQKQESKAIAEILYSKTIGHAPEFAPEGALLATEAILKEANLKVSDIDLFEISDSFAVNALIVKEKWSIPQEKINVLGGIVAYGHAYGATGCINLLHLIAALKKGEKGLVAVPGAGGQSTAMIIRKLA
jgi:acetyl-CoA C-acetyltransferase